MLLFFFYFKKFKEQATPNFGFKIPTVVKKKKRKKCRTKQKYISRDSHTVVHYGGDKPHILTKVFNSPPLQISTSPEQRYENDPLYLRMIQCGWGGEGADLQNKQDIREIQTKHHRTDNPFISTVTIQLDIFS